MSVLDRFAPQSKSLLGAGNPSQMVLSGGPPSTYSAQRTARIGDAVADVSFVYEVHHSVLNYAAPVPVKVFDLDADGERKESFTHPVYELLRRPNPRHDAYAFREYLFASRLSFGEHFIAKQRGPGGKVIALWPLRPDRLREVVADDGELLGFMLNYNSEHPIPLPLSEVIWGTSYNPTNDYRGGSPIEAMRWQIELGRDAEHTAADFYANNGFVRGVLKVNKRAGTEGLQRLASDFRQMLIGSGNRFRIPVFEEGMDYEPIQLPPADAEYINTAKLTRSRVAAAYGWALPEEWTSTQAPELRRLRFHDAVVPLAAAIEASLQKDLMGEYPGAAFVEFQLAHILNADFPQLVEAGKTAVYSALMTPNEFRRKFLNLPSLPGGDEMFVPLNLSPVSDLSENPRAADSGGGMGGSEGRTESTASASVPTEAKAINAQRYAKARRRKMDKLTEALHNRIRGVLKRELADIRSLKADLPPAAELERIVRERDPELAKLIGQFLEQSALAGAEAAGLLVGVDPVDISNLSGLFGQRADAVAHAFGTTRGSWLIDLLAEAQSGGMSQRDFMNAVADGYGQTFSTYGERVARTEVAYAHEAAARESWANLGATGSVWNFGGGPCTTGDCEAMDGQVAPTGAQFTSDAFGGIDGPPSHNNCTCYTTPTFDSLTPPER